MPKGSRFAFPAGIKFDLIKPEALVSVRSIARLSSVPPVVVEMAQRLVANPTQGAQFKLGDRAMKDKANDIELFIVKGLRKFLRATDVPAKVKSYQSPESITFWLDS